MDDAIKTTDTPKTVSCTTSRIEPEVYSELRSLAQYWLANEKPGQTLQPTALVHEAYLRLMKPDAALPWANRAHFFAAAAEAMRRILVENARRKKRLKHGGELNRVELEDTALPVRLSPDEILDLDHALEQLTEQDPEAAQIVTLHYFAGISIDEAAESLGISRATAYRQWTYARAWLRCAMGGLTDGRDVEFKKTQNQ